MKSPLTPTGSDWSTSGMICSGQGSWAPFSYPNRIALPAGEFLLDLPADVEVIEGQAP